jgi:hypothetical protein
VSEGGPDDREWWARFTASVGDVCRGLGIPLARGGWGEQAAAGLLMAFRAARAAEKRESGGSFPALAAVPSTGRKRKKRSEPPDSNKGGGSLRLLKGGRS